MKVATKQKKKQSVAESSVSWLTTSKTEISDNKRSVFKKARDSVATTKPTKFENETQIKFNNYKHK